MIDMSQITEYVSVEKQMLLDAQKYIDRAEMYLKIGKTKHALGCMVKAYKKYEKSEQFSNSNLMLYPIISSLSNRIADKILNGA